VPASMSAAAVQVMVELDRPPASVTYAAAYKVAQAEADAARQDALTHPTALALAAAATGALKVEISASAAAQVKSEVQQLDQAQQWLLPALTGAAIDGKVMFRVQRAYNGIAMVVSRKKVSEILKMPGVKAVHFMHPKYPTALSDIDFLGARSFWTKTIPSGGVQGVHGENVKIADIDTGLDYIHTNFGGPGTQAAYADVSDKSVVPNPHFPSAKVPGGYDFAGDDYDGSNFPEPDPNPMDSSNSHGTATASLIGGYGVNFGGSTYFGPYDNSTNIGAMKISPGFAPKGEIYPLRVFGISGSTNLVTAAIDWTMDPNGDGDFSDRMDVVNMSLGHNQGFADDPDSVAAANAASAGIIVCSAAGNAGDTYYIHSSPASAPGTLSVAASINEQAGFVYNASVTGESPNLSGKKGFGIYASTSPKDSVTGDVVYARPPDASAPLTNSAAVAGRIVLIDRGAVTFSEKAQYAMAAGATGIIVVNNIPGNPIRQNTDLAYPPITIPDVLIPLNAGTTLKNAAAFDEKTGIPASPTKVTIAPEKGTIMRTGTAADTMASYSSRGPALSGSGLKPDITAPAEVVGVALSLSGNELGTFNGTSSATPHVAGSMALMKQLHPTWTVEELMALVMNTATHDLFVSSPSASPVPSPNPKYGVGRVGAGRIDLTKASQANVIAYNGTDQKLVSVSFGNVEVPVDGSVSLDKVITVSNKGATSTAYNVTYQNVNGRTGADFNFAGAASFNVPAGGTFSLPVNFTAIGSQLKHGKKQSVSSTQSVVGGDLGRQYLTEKAGYAVLTPTGNSTEPVIRVPLYAAPKPVSSLHATVSGFVPSTPTGQFTVSMSGSGIFNGTAWPTDIISLVKGFELQYASPQVGSRNAPADPNVLKYVGVMSDYTSVARTDNAEAKITFGLEGFGDAAVPEFNSSDKEIFLDIDQDGLDDFVIFFGSRASGSVHSNVYFPALVYLNAGFGIYLGNYTNTYPGNQLDTNSFNNSIISCTVNASSLGLAGIGQPTKFNYHVRTFDRNGFQVDETPVMTYDLAKPGFEANDNQLEPFFDVDSPGPVMTVNYNGANYRANRSLGLVLFHMHNGTSQRSDVIAFHEPFIHQFSPIRGPVGTRVTITGANFGPGTVVFWQGKVAAQLNVISANTLVATVPSGATSGPIRVSNAAGSSVSTTSFDVTPAPDSVPTP